MTTDAARKKRRLRLLLASLALTGLALILYTTAEAAWVGGDTVIYVGEATNLAEGKGLTLPVSLPWMNFSPAEAVAFDGRLPTTGLPPLYPSILAVGDVAGIDVLTWAGIVNAVSFAVVVSLVGVLSYLLAGRSLFAAGLSGVLVLASQPTVRVFSFAQPEGIFMVMTLVGLLLLWRYQASPSVMRLAVLTLVSLAGILTRLAGFALVGTVGLTLLFLLSGSWSRRVRLTGAYALGILVPYGLISVVGGGGVESSNNTSFSNSIVWHPPGLADLTAALTSVRLWFMSPPIPAAAAALLTLAVAGAAVVAVIGWRAMVKPPTSPDDQRVQNLAGIIVLYIVLYMMILLFSSALLDTRVVPAGRLLVPITALAQMLLIAGVIWFVRMRVPAEQRRVLVGAAMGLAAIMVLMLALDTNQRALQVRPPDFRDIASPARDYVNALPDDMIIFTNQPEKVYVPTGRELITTPWRFSNVTGQPNDQLDEDLAELAEILTDDNVILIWIPEVGGPSADEPELDHNASFRISLDDLTRTMDLVELETFGGGITIYSVATT